MDFVINLIVKLSVWSALVYLICYLIDFVVEMVIRTVSLPMVPGAVILLIAAAGCIGLAVTE